MPDLSNSEKLLHRQLEVRMESYTLLLRHPMEIIVKDIN